MVVGASQTAFLISQRNSDMRDFVRQHDGANHEVRHHGKESQTRYGEAINASHCRETQAGKASTGAPAQELNPAKGEI